MNSCLLTVIDQRTKTIYGYGELGPACLAEVVVEDGQSAMTADSSLDTAIIAVWPTRTRRRHFDIHEEFCSDANG